MVEHGDRVFGAGMLGLVVTAYEFIAALAGLIGFAYVFWAKALKPSIQFFRALRDDISDLNKRVGRNGRETVFETLHQHSHALARVTTLSDVMPAPIFEADLYGRVTYINHSCERMTGNRFADVHGMEWIDTIPDRRERDEYLRDWLQAIEQLRTFDHDVTIIGQDGRRLRVNVRASPMRSGEHVVGYRGVVERLEE